jgi:hypothetical protein
MQGYTQVMTSVSSSEACHDILQTVFLSNMELERGHELQKERL